MKNKQTDITRLKHIIESIENIEKFCDGVSYQDYSNDLKLRLAIVKLLEIIGKLQMELQMKHRINLMK